MSKITSLSQRLQCCPLIFTKKEERKKKFSIIRLYVRKTNFYFHRLAVRSSYDFLTYATPGIGTIDLLHPGRRITSNATNFCSYQRTSIQQPLSRKLRFSLFCLFEILHHYVRMAFIPCPPPSSIAKTCRDFSIFQPPQDLQVINE